MNKSKGIDISVWQGDIDFNKVKDSGIDFVILREGYGRNNIDKNFLRYVEQIHQVEDLEVKGVYHFSYALDENSARQEAKECVKNVLEAGLPKSTIIFFDLEYDTVDYAKKKGVVIGKKECILHTRAFCEEVERLGFKAGIYFNNHYYKHMYDKHLLNKYVKWLADWTGEPNVECTFHQYSDSGNVPGIKGNVDMNYYLGKVTIEENKKPSNPERILQAIQDVFDGKYGDGEDRIKALTEAGFGHKHIQHQVNRINKISKAVINGDWGNGEERKRRLEEAGHPYDLIQYRVNQIMGE